MMMMIIIIILQYFRRKRQQSLCRLIQSSVQKLCVLHIQSNTSIFHLVVQWVSYGGRERSVQGAGGETRGEETPGETKA